MHAAGLSVGPWYPIANFVRLAHFNYTNMPCNYCLA